MKIKITYVGTINGTFGLWCGFKPDNADITEERPVLYAKDGFELVRISDGENVGSSVWLKDGDVKENYEEVEAEDGIH